MVVTNNETLAKKVACLRNYGQDKRYHHPELGANSRLDVRASYDITSNLDVEANVYNVLNTPVIMDMPVVGDIRQYSVYGPRYYMSVKYRM